MKFSENTALYAQWTQDPVITFDANGGKGTMGTQTVKPNEATALTANTFTRADYDFTGWNTAKDGTGTALWRQGKHHHQRKCHPLRPVDAAQVPCPLAELGRHSLAEGRLHLRGYGWMG